MYKKVVKDATVKVWGMSPAGSTLAEGMVPGSKEFFDTVFKKRSTYEVPWLYTLVPFESFRGRKVLELGCGAGYDAFEFCRNGALYVGIDITPENIDRTKKHLSFYGYAPKVLAGDAENLEFQDESFDVVFSNGVLHHTPDISKSFSEAFRVLVKQGNFYVILYHKHSVFYWLTLWLFDHIMRFGFRKRSMKERLSMIEYTASSELPLVNVYSRRELENILNSSGFHVDDIAIRKLVREDLPAIPFIHRLWNYVPQRILDILAKKWGWYLVAKATKTS